MKQTTTSFTRDKVGCDQEIGSSYTSRPDGWILIHYSEADGWLVGPKYLEAYFCCFEHAAIWCYQRKGQDYQPIIYG